MSLDCILHCGCGREFLHFKADFQIQKKRKSVNVNEALFRLLLAKHYSKRFHKLAFNERIWIYCSVEEQYLPKRKQINQADYQQNKLEKNEKTEN